MIAGFLLGSTHDGISIAGVIPNEWISALVGGNSVFSNLFASVVGAFMYFATLTEVPIVQGLLASGMGKGPALGPAPGRSVALPAQHAGDTGNSRNPKNSGLRVAGDRDGHHFRIDLRRTLNLDSLMSKLQGISFFDRYLTLWVALCIVAGIAIGKLLPVIPETLGKLEYANVSIPIAILIWIMIFPMMMKIDFGSIVNAFKMPKGLTITLVVNWLIKPFTMFGFAWLFFYVIFKAWISPELAKEYLAGAVLLGAAPCTAMVFVWSHLTRGNPAYTLVQVAINDLIILIAFIPIVTFLLGVSGIAIPWNTLLLSVVLFVVIPLLSAMLTRRLVIRHKGLEYFNQVFLKKFTGTTISGLLLTLVIIFSFQGDIILKNPFSILLIAVPLVIQTFFIFFIAYGWAYRWKIPHDIAAPAAMIGASNFFELSVAVAIVLFGLNSGATLVTVVGVLVEVPVMLTLVRIANTTHSKFS